MKAAFFSDRGIIKVTGENLASDTARAFLNGLFTCDMVLVRPGVGIFGALLTPQGKIIADFIVTEIPQGHGGGFLLDCPRAVTSALLDKLNLYKLRAKIAFEDISENFGVLVVWDSLNAPDLDLACADPRTDRLGWRVLIPQALAEKAAAFLGADLVDASEYDEHRISLRVPRGGVDFAYGGTFPHEANMDLLNGVSFTKGCYVGQEVVSRMQHRGSARTRILRIIGDGALPEPGIAVEAANKTIGTLGSSFRARDGRRWGLAMLRIDRVADARAQGLALTAGNVPIQIHPDDDTMIPKDTADQEPQS